MKIGMYIYNINIKHVDTFNDLEIVLDSQIFSVFRIESIIRKGYRNLEFSL